MAPGSQRSQQAMQLQFRAKQRSLNASATISGHGSDIRAETWYSVEMTGRLPFSESAISSAVFPRENNPCLKNFLREMFMFSLYTFLFSCAESFS
jgi:hypothetical protein